MSDKNFKPKIDPSKSEERKPAAKRQAQIRQGKERLQKGAAGRNANPITTDETYGGLREENRVVMRHQIALNLDSFRAAPADFVARPVRDYPPLRTVAPPFFSVIIPNFNGRRFLPGLLGALQRQTFSDFEIIFADDASTDHSVAFVEENYPAVRLVVNRRNEGFARTCNIAADAAHGRILVLLNNDTEPEPGFLAELARAVCAYPEAAIFAGKLLLYDERNKLHTTGDLMGVDGTPRNRGVWEEDRGQYDQASSVFGVCGGAAAFRKELWRQLGGFDEEMWMYLEDADFSFRARLMGSQAVFVPGARVYHHLSATGGGVMASYYVGRNTIWTLAKNMPRSLLIRHAPRIIAAQLRVALDALRNIRGEAARARLRGQVAGILGLPRQLRKRQIIQMRRQIEDADLARLLSETTR
ncbi:MAG: glycosyltransferase family 2 protein [Chloroflexi bacterium]|nr:MAG: glycosyltransferase family 2 protein [Chloroflexota bacterium]